MRLQRVPLSFSILISCLTGLVLSRYSLPLTADDYGAIVASASSAEQYAQFVGPLLARFPLGMPMSLLILKLQIWEFHPVLFFMGCMLLHATAFALLVDWIIEQFNFPKNETKLAGVVGFLAFLPHALFPNNYEIHTWYSIAIHPLGALLAVLGIRSKRSWVRIALLGASLCFYETYLFLAVGALLVEGVVWRSYTGGKHLFIRRALEIASALSIVFILRAGFTWVASGSNQRELVWSLSHFLPRLSWVVKSILVLNFRKENWPAGVLEWFSLALILIFTSKKILDLKKVCFLLLIPFVIAMPVALLPYQAVRAFYGPNLLRAAIFCAFTFYIVTGSYSVWKKALPVMLLLLSYGIQWERILSVKHHNSQMLSMLEAETRSRIAACADPCVLSVPRPDSRVENDWVINSFYFPSFYERIRLRSFPGKKVTFLIDST